MFTFCVLLVIFIILMRVFQNRIVGFIGEAYTMGIVKSATNGYVFHDVYVKGSHGVQQIDIIAVANSST